MRNIQKMYLFCKDLIKNVSFHRVLYLIVGGRLSTMSHCSPEAGITWKRCGGIGFWRYTPGTLCTQWLVTFLIFLSFAVTFYFENEMRIGNQILMYSLGIHTFAIKVSDDRTCGWGTKDMLSIYFLRLTKLLEKLLRLFLVCLFCFVLFVFFVFLLFKCWKHYLWKDSWLWSDVFEILQRIRAWVFCFVFFLQQAAISFLVTCQYSTDCLWICVQYIPNGITALKRLHSWVGNQESFIILAHLCFL